ncbi:hypothetical protein BHM03_00060281, partial [Ensete ventricosum]
AATVHSYGGDFLHAYPGRTIEPRGTKDKDRSPTSHAEAYSIQAPAPKKLIRDSLHERSARELYWHCNEPWSREHRCKKGRLLVIKPAENENNETSEEALEPKEEAMEEGSQPTDYAAHALAGYSNPQLMKVEGPLKQQLITVPIDTGRTNNFLNSKVVARLALQIEGPWHERGVKLEELQSMLTLDWALIILNHTRGQSSFQKKDWLSLKTNHMTAHAKKKRPPDKLQNRRKIEDRVFLHLQPDQQETRASMKWSPYFFGPCKIKDHIGALTWRSNSRTRSRLQLIRQVSHLK